MAHDPSRARPGGTPLTHDLVAAAERVASRIGLPPVTGIHVPGGERGRGVEGEFGLVVLADGSAGLFFALLGDTLARLRAGPLGPAAAERSPLALARGLGDDDPAVRAVALGCLSAIAQHLFRRAGYVPPEAADAMGGGGIGPGDRVGMVGLFPSLARRLRGDGIPLTVLELRADKVTAEPGFEVTLDPARLRGCSRILCTASTLVNGSLDAVLAYLPGSAHVAVIGPSAGCLPDPLFARGIDAVGGTRVLHAQALSRRIDRGEPWGGAVRRYLVDAGGYPGLEALLALAGDAGANSAPGLC